MSKNQPLTAKEYENYRIKGAFLRVIERFARENDLEPHEINVLDWGCGTGRLVLRLRELGYNAFGVDLDPLPIQNGKDLFTQKGQHITGIPDVDFPLCLLQERPQGGLDTKFPDGFFHCVFSGQVLEHIRDLDGVIREIDRVTSPGGIGYHNFPAQRHIKETHLFMPFVHWLPKNDLRRRLISLYLTMGIQPDWEQVRSKPRSEQAAVYYAYSVEKTYYRPASTILAAFQSAGFQAWYDPISSPRMDRFRPYLKTPLLRRAASAFLTTFVLADLYLKKPA